MTVRSLIPTLLPEGEELSAYFKFRVGYASSRVTYLA